MAERLDFQPLYEHYVAKWQIHRRPGAMPGAVYQQSLKAAGDFD